MLLFLTIVLIVSSVAMAALLYAKHWELSTGRMLLPGMRPHASRLSIRFFVLIERRAPEELAFVARASARWLRAKSGSALARILISVEHSLEAMLDGLKHAFSPVRGAAGSASSAFLREVAEEKRKLTRVARMRKASSEGNPEQTRPQ